MSEPAATLTLTFLGTGTSQGVPVIGCRCSTCLSPDPRDRRLRSSALLGNGSTTVLVDCGPDIRQQLLRAGVARVDALLLTHEHNDHLIGLDDLRPLIFARRRPFPIYAEPRVLAEVRARFAYAFAKTPYPGAPSFELHEIAPGRPIALAGFASVQPLRVLHGRLPILGFRVGAVAYLTDVKAVPPETLAALVALDVLVTSALHAHEHHSHMTVVEATAFAKTVGARQTYFIHMSHYAGRHAELAATLPAGVALAYDQLTVVVEPASAPTA